MDNTIRFKLIAKLVGGFPMNDNETFPLPLEGLRAAILKEVCHLRLTC